MYHPISLDRPLTRPVVPVANGADISRQDRERQPSTVVYHGDLLENAGDRSYRPRLNLQISPENRRAINAYHRITDEPAVPGKILDGYV